MMLIFICNYDHDDAGVDDDDCYDDDKIVLTIQPSHKLFLGPH